MKQIEELQGRILAAMERIGVASEKAARMQTETLAKMKAAEAQAVAGNSELELALEEEKVANAQLEERVKVLHQRLKEAEENTGSPAAGGDVAAMQAELELLRNEVGNTDERDALKQEIQRLKQEHEVSANGTAAELVALRQQVETLQEENRKLSEAQNNGVADDIGSAVDMAALEAENKSLRGKLEAAQASGSAVNSDGENETLQRLDQELQALKTTNEELRTSNLALREANEQAIGDATLINAAMKAELDGLRAVQATDTAQVNAVLSKLEPLLATARSLPEGEEV